MLKYAVLCMTLLPMLGQAQAPAVPQATLEELSKDLAKLQQAVMEAQAQLQGQAPQQTTQAGYPGSQSVKWFTPDLVMVSVPSAKIKAGADFKTATILDGVKGSKFPIVDRAGDWYAVGLGDSVKGFKTGWVNAEAVVPEKSVSVLMAGVNQPSTSVYQPSTSSAELILLKLTEMASALKQKYETNPHVTVTGFTFNAAVPPSVSVNFEFKKK